MKKKLFILPIVASIGLSIMFFVIGCEKEKKTGFELQKNILTGKVIGFETCTDDVEGCLLEVISPSGLGNSIYYDGEQYSNVVKTYSIPVASIQLNQTITGEYQILPDSQKHRVCPAMHTIFPVVEISLTY